ncbi:MAG: anti-sigma factor family protein [Armatimonadota bacterium]
MSMRLECEEIRQSLSAFVDGELDSARRKVVSAHLLTCDECSKLAGRLSAAKGAVERDDADTHVPAGFLERLQERIDAVEGVRKRVRRPGRARRITAIAAAGAIAVSVALIFSTVYYMNTDRALDLAQMHRQITAMPGPVPGGGGFSNVSCDPSRDTWHQAHQALINVDGVLVTYTLYRVGRCPVSVYSGPMSWKPYRTGWLVSDTINGLQVRRVGDHAMTSWTDAGRRHVLVATMPAEAVASLARARMSLPGRSSAF